MASSSQSVAINYGRAGLNLASGMIETLAADSGKQGIEPLERAIGGIEGAGEAFGGTLGLERKPRGAGEGRGAAPAHPRQQIAPFLTIPATHQFRGLKPRIVLQPDVFERKIAHMDAPQTAQRGEREARGEVVAEEGEGALEPRQR